MKYVSSSLRKARDTSIGLNMVQVYKYSLIALVSVFPDADDTFQVIEVQSRPPCPEDEEASIVKLSHEDNALGPIRYTDGTTALSGTKTVIFCAML
jgi:hypothetical protein